VIAAVNGVAHGGGFETALACDIIIASQEKADFALPEPKVGLMASAGGVVRLPRIIGYHNAMGMILTGRRVGAEEAQSVLSFLRDPKPITSFKTHFPFPLGAIQGYSLLMV
jgi:enoyl-CoA hydratase/carnithine racemase